MSDAEHQEARDALRRFLCDYFLGDAGDCTSKRTGAIAPIGADAGWKLLKVRWGIPGGGKRGGLRLAVAVHCDDRRVAIVDAEIRRDEPDADAMLALLRQQNARGDD